MLLQVSDSNRDAVEQILGKFNLADDIRIIGSPCEGQDIQVSFNNQSVLQASRIDLHRIWSETTYHMQKMRDNPKCAQQEYDTLLDTNDSGLFADLSFDVRQDISAPYRGTKNTPYSGGIRPKVAVLREQGVNGHLEMAAAFTHAGFTAVDVTMTDIIQSRVDLNDFKGMAACGGFSYGDVLGAGEGWAKSIMV